MSPTERPNVSPIAPLDRDHWRRVLVYGLGASGQAAIEALRARGIDVLGVDDRATASDLSESTRFQIASAAELDRLPEDIDAIVKSPGVPAERPLLEQARQRGVPVIGEIELAFPWMPGEMIGITGSNGKSTTTALTGNMLEAHGLDVEVCGNFGPPLSSRLDGPAGRVFVTELSSFQLEDSFTVKPRVAALLNLAADHLDRHGDLDAYIEAKRRIFARLDHESVAVLNGDDPRTAATPLPPGVRRRTFSLNSRPTDGCWVEDGVAREVEPGQEDQTLFDASEVPLAGPHNLENALAAALLARSFGASIEAVRAGLLSFEGLPHRVQRVAELRGVSYYDDSKGTNPAATERSLAGFADGSVHLILGGQTKGADLSSLRPSIERKVARLYLVGESAPTLARLLDGAAPFEHSKTVERAVADAATRASAGDVVLLSPACASFDQFQNFKERGLAFQRAVAEIATGDEVGDG